jgi:hypothetical protein
MRVFARGGRPHPGAQLTLFEAAGGWRYCLWAANLPAGAKGWRGQCAYIDAGHRVHARVEDVIRTGKDTGLGHFPSRDYELNKGVARCVDDRLHPAVLAQAPRPGRQARQSGTENAALPHLPRSRPTRPRRTPQDPENRRILALVQHHHHHRLAAHPGAPGPHLSSTNRPNEQRKKTRGPWNPATRPDSRATGMPRHVKTRCRNRQTSYSGTPLSSVKVRARSSRRGQPKQLVRRQGTGVALR